MRNRIMALGVGAIVICVIAALAFAQGGQKTNVKYEYGMLYYQPTAPDSTFVWETRTGYVVSQTVDGMIEKAWGIKHPSGTYLTFFNLAAEKGWELIITTGPETEGTHHWIFKRER